MPSYTAQQLINIALTNLGILDQGGTPSVSDSNEALIRLNMLIGQWRLQNYFIWQIVRNAYQLAAGQVSGTLGTTQGPPPVPGTLGPVRPDYIQNAFVSLPGPNPANPLERMLSIVPQEIYAAHPDKNALAEVPSEIYNDRGSPLSTIYLWPRPRVTIPNSTILILNIWSQLPYFAALGTVADLPDGYDEALSNALAIRCVSMFGVVVNSDTVQLCNQLALGAEDKIKQLNATARGLMMPPQIQQAVAK